MTGSKVVLFTLLILENTVTSKQLCWLSRYIFLKEIQLSSENFGKKKERRNLLAASLQAGTVKWCKNKTVGKTTR